MLQEPELILNRTYSKQSICHGNVLEKTVFKKLIKEKHCEIQRKKLQIIFSNKINGKIISMAFEQNSTIFHMKNTIRKKILLKLDEFYLEFHGEHLDNDKTMNYYQIDDKSIINIIGTMRGGRKIQIETVNGKLYGIEISDSETVMNLKQKIRTQTNLLENEQELYLENKKLQNNQTIRDLKLNENSVIRCAYKKSDIIITVNVLGTSAISLNVNNNTKIKDIKQMIKNKTGIDVDKQIISYEAKSLENDNETLDSYGVDNGSALLVVATVPGGEFTEDTI